MSVETQVDEAGSTSLPRTMAVARLLGGLVLLLAVLGAINDVVTEVHLFDVEGELKDGPNLMVIASGGVLFVAAALAFELGWRDNDSSRSPAPWYGIAALFAFMGIDELTTIHEHIDAWTGVPWQLIFLPVVLAGAAAWLVLFKRLRASDARLAAGWALAAGFWAFAQFLEVLLQKEGVGSGVLKLDVLMPAAEELSELTGSCLFLLVSLAVLESRRAPRSRAPAPLSAAQLRAARDPASPAG
jgi:hypothetical protein